MKGLNVVAHPDRAFRIRKKWKDKEIQAATKIYDAHSLDDMCSNE